ncbi:hypothetical protein [Bradyrhizobium sp. CSS354]|uniref:hypothetical protein n=1 Tax=Bradyrhizobium sp. CSS354 TaxID=2699172 RepID=UPI0023AEC614|nr:hypothetical protein [Bradyrhizobium sp. CSS354]
MALVAAGRTQCDVTVVSIFVKDERSRSIKSTPFLPSIALIRSTKLRITITNDATFLLVALRFS